MHTAAAYHVLQQYMSNTNQETGKPPTLLIYEELDGVSLGDLRTQLTQVQITIKYANKNHPRLKLQILLNMSHHCRVELRKNKFKDFLFQL